MTEKYRFILGALLTIGLFSLACSMALGHVEEKTSYGLTAVLALLGKVVLDFSDWAFRGDRATKAEPDKPEDGEIKK